MGCGSSSLKGEDVDVNAAPTMAAPKRVNTNFASVDYSADGGQGRRMTEYAPHETVKSKKSHDGPRSMASGRQSEANDGILDTSLPVTNKPLAADPLTTTAGTVTYPHEGTGSAGAVGDATNNVELKPYKTNDGWDEDTLGTNTQQQATNTPHINGSTETDTDPTSLNSKRHFAHENDPASMGNQESPREKASHKQHLNGGTSLTSSTTEGEGEVNERKKSWLGDKYSKYHAAKHGKNVVLSDEDLKKYTGKDRAELNEWAQGRNVGANMPAGRYRDDYSGGGGYTGAGG
ncbi:hypothetical protein LTR84_011030 [Exophiala bonariae]|uniref:Uncharacterized protein n=1 Tax=Exophiala bonariae TaxID=1690606 RepID=A0AAV9NLS2_9EURO|nr:hypothetical protein LTR84_011030 [Exophiala bonariae]